MKTIRPEGLACTCVHCGALFQAWSPLTRYCSTGCRTKARRSRSMLPASSTAPATITTQPALSLPGTIEVRNWKGCPISRRADDGYINATAMCKAGGKRLNNYLRNDRTLEYMAALAASVVAEKPCGAAVAPNRATGTSAAGYVDATGAPVRPMAMAPSQLVDVRQGGQPDQQGTWIHPRLAVDLARWISPAFAVWMDGWFLDVMAGGPTLPPAAPPALAPSSSLPKGVHVVASTKREAAELWYQAIRSEVNGAMARRLSPAHRTDAGLPLDISYRYVETT